jgi:hypothetical protein
MRDVHVGDVHQDTYVANVRQGDTVVVQQIPVVQYVPVFALPPQTPPTSTARRGLTRRPPPFATSLTNPDNPWGFDFPPTVLVK